MKNILSSMIIFAVAAVLLSASDVSAQKGAQVFNVYDNTQDGLQVGTDQKIGNVQFNANPGGADRIIVQTHLQKAAPNCTYNVQLVRDSEASNGGLDATGHFGLVQSLGTLTTNKAGNGNAHFDLDPSATGTGDTQVYGHLDFEAIGSCEEAEGDLVVNNEYGAAFDPALATPLTWME